MHGSFSTHPALHELLAGDLEGPAPGDERLALEDHVDGHQDDAHHLPGDALVPSDGYTDHGQFYGYKVTLPSYSLFEPYVQI